MNLLNLIRSTSSDIRMMFNIATALQRASNPGQAKASMFVINGVSTLTVNFSSGGKQHIGERSCLTLCPEPQAPRASLRQHPLLFPSDPPPAPPPRPPAKSCHTSALSLSPAPVLTIYQRRPVRWGLRDGWIRRGGHGGHGGGGRGQSVRGALLSCDVGFPISKP